MKWQWSSHKHIKSESSKTFLQPFMWSSTLHLPQDHRLWTQATCRTVNMQKCILLEKNPESSSDSPRRLRTRLSQMFLLLWLQLSALWGWSPRPQQATSGQPIQTALPQWAASPLTSLHLHCQCQGLSSNLPSLLSSCLTGLFLPLCTTWIL